MLLMCASPWHTRCFFKMQSINAPRIGVFRRAWPTVPWAFVYRDPVQTMMSHMKGATGGVCLRSHGSPTSRHAEILGVSSKSAASRSSKEDFCAAHLAYLCLSAFDEAQSAQIAPGAGHAMMIPCVFRETSERAARARRATGEPDP